MIVFFIVILIFSTTAMVLFSMGSDNFQTLLSWIFFLISFTFGGFDF